MKKIEKQISYKAFDKDFKCKDFQFEVGKEYKHTGKVKICGRGFHSCTNPFDVFNYYPLIKSRFAEVEVWGMIDKKEYGDSKICSEFIFIKRELTEKEMNLICVDYLIKECENSKNTDQQIAGSGDNQQIAGSGDNQQIAGSGNYQQIAGSGDNQQIAGSGYNQKIAGSGNYQQIAGSGDNQQIAGSGDNQQIAGSGYNQQIAGSGDNQQIAGSGNYQKIAGSGYNQQIAGSGYNQQIAGSGDNQQIAGSGDNQQIAGSGDNQQIAGSGNYQQIAGSGNYQQIEVTGKDTVCANIGINSQTRGVKGTWITLAEYEQKKDDKYIPLCVKSAQIDGKKIKENVFYQLKGGKFVEVE